MAMTTVDAAPEADGSSHHRDGPARKGFGRGAGILSVGIGTTGLLTAAYFSIASHVLGAVAAKRVDLLWSIIFVVISVIYRPVEQTLSRTIAHRRAIGLGRLRLRMPVGLLGGAATVFVVAALALRTPLRDDVFDGSSALYWLLVASVVLYAGSYFARGWLAGHELFGLYGALVFMEAMSRCAFAVAVLIGVTSGQSAVALGIAAAPLVSLVVVPLAFARRHAAERAAGAVATDPLATEESEASTVRFALSVAGIMLAEQALLNVAVLTVDASATNAALAGIVFNVLLIARAPLQLFQAVQTSLLPHLAGLEATEGHDAFAHAIRMTLLAIAAFAGAVALGLLAIGPFVMSHAFGQHFDYGRVGLAVVGIGMGLHLTAGTLNQAALARGQAALSSAAWLTCSGLFVVWTLLPIVHGELLRVEVGYALATGLLSLALFGVYRAGERARNAVATV